MGRPLRIVYPHTRNGVYLDRSFGSRRRRPLRARLIALGAYAVLGVAWLIASVGVLALLFLVVVVPIWLLLAIGRAIGASSW